MKIVALAALATALVAVPATAAHHEEKKKALNFKEMDTDGSKSISLEEWTAGHRNPKAHAKVDTDGDGQVSWPEMKAQRERWKAQQAQKAK